MTPKEIAKIVNEANDLLKAVISEGEVNDDYGFSPSISGDSLPYVYMGKAAYEKTFPKHEPWNTEQGYRYETYIDGVRFWTVSNEPLYDAC